MNGTLRRKKKLKEKKKLVLFISFIVLAIAVGTFITIKFNDDSGKVYSKVEAVENGQGNNGDDQNNGTNDTSEEKLKDRYLSLEEDPNAEDAMEVFSNTEGILKGTKQYPIRTDGKKVVYLTFDDGPSTENTLEILDILDQNDIKGTFFVLGSSVDASEESKGILKEIAYNGHAIANHTYGHNYKFLYPNKKINAENFMGDIEKCNDSLRNVLGEDFKTRVIRFPGGYWSWNGRENVRPMIDAKGYAILDWNALNGDAEGHKKNSEQLLARTKESVEALGPNADSIVLLMHDTYGKSETVKALPKIISYFKEKGFEFKTIK